MQRRFKVPSPSMGVAIAALVIGLVGTASAAGVLITSSKQIKPGVIDASDLSKKARKALTGAKGAPGAKGDAGAPGAAGAAGSAAAYALVNGDGSVNGTQAKNIAAANVTRGAAGTYCFSGLAFGPTNVIATISGLTGGGAGDAQASVFAAGDSRPSAGCPANAQAVVYTVNNATSLADYAFYVAFN